MEADGGAEALALADAGAQAEHRLAHLGDDAGDPVAEHGNVACWSGRTAGRRARRRGSRARRCPGRRRRASRGPGGAARRRSRSRETRRTSARCRAGRRDVRSSVETLAIFSPRTLLETPASVGEHPGDDRDVGERERERGVLDDGLGARPSLDGEGLAPLEVGRVLGRSRVHRDRASRRGRRTGPGRRRVSRRCTALTISPPRALTSRPELRSSERLMSSRISRWASQVGDERVGFDLHARVQERGDQAEPETGDRPGEDVQALVLGESSCSQRYAADTTATSWAESACGHGPDAAQVDAARRTVGWPARAASPDASRCAKPQIAPISGGLDDRARPGTAPARGAPPVSTPLSPDQRERQQRRTDAPGSPVHKRGAGECAAARTVGRQP